MQRLRRLTKDAGFSQYTILNIFRQHLQIFRAYSAAIFVVLLTIIDVLYVGLVEHKLAHSIGYVFAVWLGAFATDLVIAIHPKPAIGFPIKHAVMKEVSVILGCTFLGMVFLSIRFIGNQWETMLPVYRLICSSLLLFTFPILLALIYLIYYRYRPKELGINLHYWYLPLLIHLIFGGITLAVVPRNSHWHSFIGQYGILGALFTGLITAALPEEFTRMLLQTRLGSAFCNKGLGFVIATFIWACMHIPINLHQDPRTSFVSVLSGSLAVMPIGFLWGYLTHRTKSLLPAVFVHGPNFWGLQNFHS
jgi:membrane protease YdiL (CAAX protease family)